MISGIIFMLAAVTFMRQALDAEESSQTISVRVKWLFFGVPSPKEPHGLLMIAAVISGCAHLFAATAPLVSPVPFPAAARMVTGAALVLAMGQAAKLPFQETFPNAILTAAAFAFLTVAEASEEILTTAASWRWCLFLTSVLCSCSVGSSLTYLLLPGDNEVELTEPLPWQVPLDCFRTIGASYLVAWMVVDLSDASKSWEAVAVGCSLDVLFLVPAGHVLLKRLQEAGSSTSRSAGCH